MRGSRSLAWVNRAENVTVASLIAFGGSDNSTSGSLLDKEMRLIISTMEMRKPGLTK